MLPFAASQSPFCVVVAMLASDTSKTLKAAPGTGKTLVITRWSYRSTTSAAQAITLAGGTVTIDTLPASITVGNRVEGPAALDIGVQLQSGQALVATPAAAGPAGIFIVEGYTINK